MLVGQLNKFEIWQADRWQQQIEQDIQIGNSGTMATSEELKLCFISEFYMEQVTYSDPSHFTVY